MQVTLPVLWDRERRTIVSNESSEIIVMFNSAFDAVGANDADYYPGALRSESDALNARIYRDVNNGVYAAGFARTQESSARAATALFTALDDVDKRLSRQRYLIGDAPTLADERLLTTLLRFDAVYHGHFKCIVRRLVDYEHVWPYARDLFQTPGVAATCGFTHMTRHYYESMRSINPTGVVPLGPAINWHAPHGRA